MKYPLRFMHVMLLAALGMVFTCTLGVASESDEEILIGRIAHIEGKLLRYIEENKDWVNTVKDSPFGLDDTLYSGDDAKAEMIMPNKTWLRIDENTQVQLINLNSDATTVDVAAGLARFYNKGEDAVIKVTTPFGYVVAPAGTVFDLYVGDESLEVIAIRGNVDFVHDNSRTKYEVWQGSSSLIADGKETAQGNGMVDSAWDDWNGKREALWTKRLRNQSTSMNLLPEPIRDQSYVLEENGQWERVHYEGAYRDMWRPTRIDPGWRPFTAGRWTVYYGDNCWIPDEPFGYVTHHYGSWVYVESFAGWYWMPPIARFNAGPPGISINFAWFPGRVGWLHSGPSIGWVPLAPAEVYYGHRRWGRRTVVISNTTVVNINIGRYRYIDEAVIIDRDYFYRGSRYTPHIQQNIGRDVIINNYRPTTVINNTIINNVTIDKRRYTYNDVEVSHKPHITVINRINDNHKAKQDFGPSNRERIEKELTHFQAKAEPSPKVEIHQPQLSSRLVGNDDIAKPFNALGQERKLIKPKERERPISKEKDQRLDPKGKGEQGQTGRRNDQEDKGRSLNIEDGNKDLQQRLKSPREKQAQGPESLSPPPSKIQRQEEERQRQENGLKKPQEQSPLPPKLEQGKQQERLQQQQQIPAPRGDKERRQRILGETGEARDINTPEDKPRLRSPRELSNKEDNRAGRKDDQLRQQENTEVANQQKLQQLETNKQLQGQELKQQQKEVQGRQKQEMQQRQQKEEQGRQQQEMQQRQQKEEQGRQQKEMQQRQQKEEQGRQQQEMQQRQQKEEQGRQQKEMQQRQQKEEQGRQQKEMQQRQQKEEQGRQQQEMQQRQQKEEQGRQQKEMQQRQQKEEQGRQQQEMQQRQQKEEQGRQQKEMQQRQQKEEQGRQQQEMQQRQKQDHQRRQDESAKQQEQAVKQKNKKQLEEEQQQQQER